MSLLYIRPMGRVFEDNSRSIGGTPLFAGWYSKDAMIAHALSFVTLRPQHFLLFLLPLLTAGITAFYMFRLWLMTFTGKPRDHHVSGMPRA